MVNKGTDSTIDTLRHKTVSIPAPVDPRHRDPSIFEKIIAWFFIAALVLTALLIFFSRIARLGNIYFGTLFVGKGKRNRVALLLTDKFPYYNQLPTAQKDNFVRRVVCFMRSKKFNFQSMPDNQDISYLISASAIQLTFGLNDFMLEHFTTIHILSNEYQHFAYATPFQGHTSDGEIYFSWPHFVHGYSAGNDKHNLGLHEMAHALTWQCFYSGGTGDRHFRNTFAAYSRVGRPLFARMQEGERNILGDYAATNYDEFWATSVEVFFEQPHQLKAELPELYEVMCKLLKQFPADT